VCFFYRQHKKTAANQKELGLGSDTESIALTATAELVDISSKTVYHTLNKL
jgi:hypothetical protein